MVTSPWCTARTCTGVYCFRSTCHPLGSTGCDITQPHSYCNPPPQNAFLKNKLKLLEKVVPVRDESVGFLTHATGLVAAAAASSNGSNGAGASSSGGGSAATPLSASPHLQYCPTVQGHVPPITSEAIEQLRKATPRQFQVRGDGP